MLRRTQGIELENPNARQGQELDKRDGTESYFSVLGLPVDPAAADIRPRVGMLWVRVCRLPYVNLTLVPLPAGLPVWGWCGVCHTLSVPSFLQNPLQPPANSVCLSCICTCMWSVESTECQCCLLRMFGSACCTC